MMRRPTRTRRLSIAAIASLVLFGVVAGAGVQSFQRYDCLKLKGWREIAMGNGCLMYCRLTGPAINGVHEPPTRYQSGDTTVEGIANGLKFGTFKTNIVTPDGSLGYFLVWIPLWFPLLLLLIIPVRWLIARPANAPAFPVITDPKRA